MSSDDKLDHKFDAIAHLVPLPKDLPPNAIPTPKSIKDWAQQNMRKFLDGHGPKEATIRDGLSLVNMSLYFEDPIVFMTESYVLLFFLCNLSRITKLTCVEAWCLYSRNRQPLLHSASRFYLD